MIPPIAISRLTRRRANLPHRCRKCCHLVIKRSPHPHSQAAQNDAAATDAAVAQISRSTEALTTIVESAAGKVREMTDGFAAEFKKIAGLTVDTYREAGYYLGDPTAWVSADSWGRG